jgi:hypothetical protein
LRFYIFSASKWVYLTYSYAITFSGRAPFFKQELANETNTFVKDKRVKPIGSDSEGGVYYFLSCNKDCKIYKETEAGLEVLVKNYEDVEKLLSKFESSKNSSEVLLVKNLKENLLVFKENDDEEKKKEAIFSRKQQAFEKAKKLNNTKSQDVEKYQSSDYFLMNISDHVITRGQLNQITKVTFNQPQQAKQPISEDERKRQKVEKERKEREKRLEKRNRNMARVVEHEAYRNSMETRRVEMLKRKRVRQRNRSKNYLSSEDEYDIESGSHSENVDDMVLYSDKEEEEGDGHDVQININNNGNNMKIADYGQQEGVQNDIILEGYLIYRFSNNQIELEGNWYMSSDTLVKEKLSYLFVKSNDYMECIIPKDDIDKNTGNDGFKIKLCSANLVEAILINKQQVFESCLTFLTGEYSGYFMYYGKTLEDRIDLNLELHDSLVRVSGDGTNNLGNFGVVGYMNFFRTKDAIVEKNEMESEYIKLAEFKITKVYTAFNPNENYRVIKSYQHRRKRIEDDI